MKWTAYAVSSFLAASSLETTSSAFVPQAFHSSLSSRRQTIATAARTQQQKHQQSRLLSSFADFETAAGPGEIDYFYDDQDEDEEFIMDPNGMTLWEIKSEIRFLGGTYDKSCRDKAELAQRLLEIRRNPPGAPSTSDSNNLFEEENDLQQEQASITLAEEKEIAASSASGSSVFPDDLPKIATTAATSSSKKQQPKSSKSSKKSKSKGGGWDPSHMSADQIKKELDTFGVDYSDCLDRIELLERWEDVRSNPRKYLGGAEKKNPKLDDVFVPPVTDTTSSINTNSYSSSGSSGGGQSLMGYTEHEVAQMSSEGLWQETPESFTSPYRDRSSNKQNDITSSEYKQPSGHYQSHQYAKPNGNHIYGNNMFGSHMDAFKKTNIKEVQMEEMKKRNHHYNKDKPAPTFLQHDGGIMNLDQLEQETFREERQMRKRRTSKLEGAESGNRSSNRRGGKGPTQASFFQNEGPMSMEQLEHEAKREERRRRQDTMQNNNSNNNRQHPPTSGPIFFHSEGTISLEELEQEARREQRERQRNQPQPMNNNNHNNINMERNMPTTPTSTTSTTPKINEGTAVNGSNPKPKTAFFQGVHVESSSRKSAAAAAAAARTRSPYREADQSIFGNQEIKNWKYKHDQSAETTTVFNGVLVEGAPAPTVEEQQQTAAAAAAASAVQQQEMESSQLNSQQDDNNNYQTPPPPPPSTMANNNNNMGQNTFFGSPDNPFSMPTIEQPNPLPKKWDPRQGYRY